MFTFVLIVSLLPSYAALIISSVWGMALLAVLSYLVAKNKKTSPLREIIMHLVVALLVIAGSKILGNVILKAIIHL